MKRLPIRGGNWNNSGDAGLFYLNLNNPRSNSNTNIGARPALEASQKRSAYWAARPCTSQKDAHSPAKAEKVNRRLVLVATDSERSSPPPLSRKSMKTYRNLYPSIYDFESLYKAYLRSRLGKRDRPSVQVFEQNLEGNLIQLQNELIWNEYRTGRYHNFEVYEPKRRLVASLPFRDRVLQHSLVAVIEPLWETRFIEHSYACRPGRGMHKGADAVQGMLRKVKREHGKVYALKADIAKYFPSINHAILQRLLARHIACEQTLALCYEIMGSTVAANEPNPCGIPIGNLTSQLWANIYLHELDKFAKHVIKARHYVRYMDDFVLIHHDKDWLHQARAVIDTFLEEHLALQTNAKTQVFPVSISQGRGLDFLGYHIWPTHRRLRKSSIRRMHRTMRKLQRMYARGEVELDQVRQTVVSWSAHASHADTHGLQHKLLGQYPFTKEAA